MVKMTLDELFRQESERRARESAEWEARPEVQAMRAERQAQQRALIEREIAEGKRDEDGEWIMHTCERCEEETPWTNVEAFEETGMLVCDACADEVLAELGGDD